MRFLTGVDMSFGDHRRASTCDNGRRFTMAAVVGIATMEECSTEAIGVASKSNSTVRTGGKVFESTVIEHFGIRLDSFTVKQADCY